MLEKGDNLSLKVIEEIKMGKSDGFGHSVSLKNDLSRKASSKLGKFL